MRYSNEFKLKCIEMYYRGEQPETPEGISKKKFHDAIRRWVRLYEDNGEDAIIHKRNNRKWTAEERYTLVERVLSGESISSVAISVAINPGQLYQWVKIYETQGYNGLICKAERPTNKPIMNNNNNDKTRPLNESEREELLRLRAENEYIKAEIEVIKKRIALRREKEAARLKAKKQQSSKNSEKEDTN